MLDDFQLYVAGEDATIIDRLNGVLMVPNDDHTFRSMCEAAGYEHCPVDDPRYGDALRKAAAAIYDNEKGD